MIGPSPEEYEIRSEEWKLRIIREINAKLEKEKLDEEALHSEEDTNPVDGIDLSKSTLALL